MKRKPKLKQSKIYEKILRNLEFQFKCASHQNDITLQIRLARAIVAFQASIGINIFNEKTLDTFNYYMNKELEGKYRK